MKQITTVILLINGLLLSTAIQGQNQQNGAKSRKSGKSGAPNSVSGKNQTKGQKNRQSVRQPFGSKADSGQNQGNRQGNGKDRKAGMTRAQKGDHIVKVLGLNEEQTEKLKGARKNMGETAKGIRNNEELSEEEKRKALHEAHKNQQEVLSGFLDEDQMSKLKEIHRQNARPQQDQDKRKPGAHIAKALGLSEEQQSKLRRCREFASKKIDHILKNKELSKEEKREKIKKISDTFRNRRNEILTDEQQAKLKEMHEAAKAEREESGQEGSGRPPLVQRGKRGKQNDQQGRPKGRSQGGEQDQGRPKDRSQGGEQDQGRPQGGGQSQVLAQEVTPTKWISRGIDGINKTLDLTAKQGVEFRLAREKWNETAKSINSNTSLSVAEKQALLKKEFKKFEALIKPVFGNNNKQISGILTLEQYKELEEIRSKTGRPTGEQGSPPGEQPPPQVRAVTTTQGVTPTKWISRGIDGINKTLDLTAKQGVEFRLAREKWNETAKSINSNTSLSVAEKQALLKKGFKKFEALIKPVFGNNNKQISGILTLEQYKELEEIRSETGRPTGGQGRPPGEQGSPQVLPGLQNR